MESMFGKMQTIFQKQGNGAASHASQHKNRHEWNIQVDRDHEKEYGIWKRVYEGCNSPRDDSVF